MEHAVALLDSLRFFVIVLGGLTILEIFFGRESLTIRQRLRGLPYWAIQLPLSVSVGAGTGALVQAIGRRPIDVPLDWAGAAAPAVAVIVGALVYDLGFYWYHRFQHRFLWRWHEPHHAFERLSAINSYHHWTEPFWGALLFGIPAGLFAWSPEVLPWLATVFVVQRYVIHSDLRFDLTPAKRLIVGASFHRIHHSIDPAHRDKNFGALTPLWDYLFGTLCWPKSGEVPAIGVQGFPEPTFRQWAVAPFKR